MNESLSIEAFNDVLQTWIGNQIKLIKLEAQDKDEIWIDLESVTYGKNDQTIDGYKSKYTLQLSGAGKILVDNNKHVELPTGTYEIPLDDETSFQFNGTTFTLDSERGHYTMEIIS